MLGSGMVPCLCKGYSLNFLWFFLMFQISIQALVCCNQSSGTVKNAPFVDRKLSGALEAWNLCCCDVEQGI